MPIGPPEEMAAEIGRQVNNICDKAMPKKRATRKKIVHWWNAEIAEKRHLCEKARRGLQKERKRSAPPEKLRQKEEALRSSRKELRKLIKKS